MTHTAVASDTTPSGVEGRDYQDIDDFIYLITHDVRASVRALLELPKWIEEDLRSAGVELNGSVAQSIEMMNRHTARLDRMLIDLLAYSRVGRMQQTKLVDVAWSLDKALSRIRIPEAMSLSRQINCPSLLIGQQDMLLLLEALIGNAVRHHRTATGQITVRTQREGEMTRLSIIDDGPGIPAHLHSKAMEAMTTLRPRDEVEGTGMGLANVRKITAHYGGYMALSEAQTGAGGLRVDVMLPYDAGD
jgi:signal transduction histidine kinase